MNETNNKQEEQKGEKVKRRTSLKNIIGGDILATDFFRRQTKLLVLIMVLILFYIHNRYDDRDRQAQERTDRYKIRCPDTQFRTDGTEPSIAYRGIHRNEGKRFADFDQSAVLNQISTDNGKQTDKQVNCNIV